MKAFHLVSAQAWNDSSRYACHLCSYLCKQGCEAKIFSDGKAPLADLLQKRDIYAGKLGFGGIARTLSSPIQLAKALEKANDDAVIHTYNFNDAYLAQKARKLYKGQHRVKVVCTIFNALPAPNDKLHSLIANELDALIFPTQEEHDKYAAGTPTGCERIRIVSPGAAALKPCNPEGTARMIFAGEITPLCGLHELIKALGEINDIDWTLDVCGEGRGNYVMPCVRTARDRGINERINWRGECNPADHISEANIGLRPTLQQSLEFMSAGLAIITDTADLRSIITDENLRKNLGEEARKTYAEKYTIERHAATILSLYNEN